MRFLSEIVFNAGDETATLNSSAIDASQMVNISAQAFFSSGTAAGTLKLQCSNDFSNATNLPFDAIVTHWNDIPSASVVVAAGATSLIPIANVCYRWVRLVWTPSGGTGTITSTIKTVNY